MNVQSEEKIDKIFRATLELIAVNGIHNTPMSAVSRKAGVAAGTIYHYFESKDILINKLYIYIKKDLIAQIMKHYDPKNSFKTSFFDIWMNYYNYLVNNPDILSFIEQCTNTPIINQETRKVADEITGPLVQFLELCIKKNVIKLSSLYLVVSLIHSSVVSLAKLHISGQLRVTEDVKMSVADYSWKGLT